MVVLLELDRKTYDFSTLEHKYNGFVKPSYEIQVNGKRLSSEDIVISSLEISTTIDARADSFAISVANAFDIEQEKFKWLDSLFVLGHSVEIQIGYENDVTPIFSGLITDISLEWPEDGMPLLRVSGMDVSFQMMQGTKIHVWEKMKYSDIARQIAGAYSCRPFVDGTKETIDFVVQPNMSDYRLLTDLAERANFDFFVIGKGLHFREPLKDKSSVLTLTAGKNVRSFHLEASLSGQLTKVVVRGWSMLEKKEIESSATEVKRLGRGSKTGPHVLKTVGKGDYTEYILENIHSVNEAKARAEAELNRRAMGFIKGRGACVGLPEIRAGRYLSIEGIGSSWSQMYYVTAAVHQIDGQGYNLQFEVEGNAV